MEAIAFYEFGGSDVLRHERDWPDPVPRPDEVVVRVRSIAVNRTTDIALREGRGQLRPPLPHIPGIAPAGEVVQVGDAVREISLGDRIAVDAGLACRTCSECRAGRAHGCRQGGLYGVSRQGGYAELAAVPERNAMRLPEGVSFEQAAAVISIFPTAWCLLVRRAELRAGETALIIAAGGAVGIAAVQIAKHAGATVIAAASADWKLERARALGADMVVNYSTQELDVAVAELTDGRGVDVVCDCVSARDLFTKGLASLADGGRLACAGSHGGGDVQIDMTRVYRRRLSILGSSGGSTADTERILELVADGTMTMPIHRTFPLAEAAAAQDLVSSRDIFGRVMLAV